MTIDHEGETPVYLQLVAILRQDIESGALPAHRPIPSKRTLVQRHEVSPGTVEHAIQVLKAEGYLKTVPGKGLFVRPEDERG